MFAHLVLPEEVKNLPSKESWALTGAKGRKGRAIASLKLAPDDLLYKHNLHLAQKYAQVSETETMSETYMCADADVVIAAYGTSARICRKAVKMLRAEGIKVGLFRPITLWPFPKKELKDAVLNAKKVLTVEMSMGQMVDDIRLNAGKNPDDVDFYGTPGGVLPKVEDRKSVV